jgi:hypothetical protein
MTTKTKTPASVTIDGRLYDDILTLLDGWARPTINSSEHRDMAARLRAVIEDDWCEDDGAGYCGNHSDWIAHYLDDAGNVLAPGSFDPEETGYTVCPHSNRYDPDKDR